MNKNISKISVIIFAFIGAVFFLSYKILDVKAGDGKSVEIKKSLKKKTNISLSDNWTGEPASNVRKLKTISAEKHMISTADILASEAGDDILAHGGNAVDAIIAAQLVLNVVEPQSSGIGGGAFLLYYDAKTKETVYFNGRETAPRKSHSKMFLDKKGNPKSFENAVKGGLSVGVPGLLRILKEAHKKYGKIPWSELFKPAINLAENGFIMSERLNVLANHVSYLNQFPNTSKTFLKKNGQAREVGDVIRNPELAQTLKTIAKKGIKPFYQGKIAKDIVKAVSKSKINPGYLSLRDLKSYKSKKGDLICAPYRKYKVCSMPLPSSGGVTLLQILGILENFDLSKYPPGTIKTVHLISEATRLAYADRNKYLADVAGVPVKKMLDKKYLKSRASLINLVKAAPRVEAGTFKGYKQKAVINNNAVELPSTTHLSAIDDSGNAISLTSSIEYYFGSAVSVDGFLLNNQLTDFSFLPRIDGKLVANRVAPGKQPRSSMTPSFVFDENDELLMVVGSPGGPRIIQYTLKAILGYLDWKMDLQQAISIPNHAILNDVIELEKNTAIAKLKPRLEEMGHQIKVIDVTSGIHAVVRNNDILKGAADPRRGGAAVGR